MIMTLSFANSLCDGSPWAVLTGFQPATATTAPTARWGHRIYGDLGGGTGWWGYRIPKPGWNPGDPIRERERFSVWRDFWVVNFLLREFQPIESQLSFRIINVFNFLTRKLVVQRTVTPSATWTLSYGGIFELSFSHSGNFNQMS